MSSEQKDRDDKVAALETRVADVLGEKRIAALTPQENRVIAAVAQILVPIVEEKDCPPEDHLSSMQEKRLSLMQENLLKLAVPERATLGSNVLMALYLTALSVRESSEEKESKDTAQNVMNMLNTVIGASQVDVVNNAINEDRHWDLSTANTYMMRNVPHLNNVSPLEVPPPSLREKGKILANYLTIAQNVSSGIVLP